jgi:FKBP-type peptidyl-prolyl cis-trans isomerase
MKKHILLRLGLCGLALHLAFAGQTTWADDSALKTEAEKASYALGMNFAPNLKRTQEILKSVGVDLDVTNFLKGLKDSAAGGQTLLTSNDVVTILAGLSEKVKAAEAAKADAQAAPALKAGQEFLEKNKALPGVTTLADGLQYKILKQGTGPLPKKTDTVNVNYRGTFIDGKEFNSSPAGQQFPVSLQPGVVIPGWTEILQLMPAGSKWQVFIPSELAYGKPGRAPLIPPNTALVFEIEVVSIAGAGDAK